MPKSLIEQKPDFSKKVNGEGKLGIAEMFSDTIQGEGVNTGVPATFIRVQGCVLKCQWCDTIDVWPHGNEYSFEEIFDLFDSVQLPERLKEGQHLVFTGGSPLRQQKRLYAFTQEFINRYGFKPYIEIENEGVLQADEKFVELVDCWNNSPKLENSGMKKKVRFKPEIIKQLNGFENSWFKFVISNESDWEEIERDFLPIIDKEKIILMPEGVTQEDLNSRREFVADMAIKYGVRFSDRLHVTIWNKQTGV